MSKTGTLLIFNISAYFSVWASAKLLLSGTGINVHANNQLNLLWHALSLFVSRFRSVIGSTLRKN